MSTKLWCAVCQTTHSQLWMASDLVLPSTQLTVLERLKGLELQLQTHCILCTACYSLVEHWDKQIDAATKTEEILKGLIPPTQHHLHGGQESVDDAFVREQQKEDAGSPTTFSDSLPLEAVEPSRVGTDGLTDAEVAVADCLVTAFGRSQSETSAQNPAVSNAAQVDPMATAVDKVNLIGSESVDGAVPPLALESESVAGAADVDVSVPVLEGPVTQCPVASVSVTDPDVDRGAAEPVTSDGHAADVATSERCTTGVAGPGEVEQSESAPRLPLSDAPESAGARHHCHICGKRFARSGSLNDHLAAHAGTKTYACGECDLRFQYRDGLLVHRRRHHGGGRLACPHCSVHFEKSCNLRRHLRVHTGERPFGCTFCPKRFAQSNGLKKHIRGLHADRVAPKSS